MVIAYILCGLAGGIIGGMGMGGGTLLIPLLNIFFGTEQHVAQATNLISFIPMAAFSLCLHFKNGLVKAKSVLPIIIAGIASCVLGSLFARYISGIALKKIFGAFLCVLSVILLIKSKKFFQKK